MKIQESGENYLETILMLEQKNGTVRSIDIANELAFSKPSVSRAMSILRSAGYITMDKNNLILLTREGRQKAEAIYERHCILCCFLEDVLGISADTAAADACRIEHIISEETFDHINGEVEVHFHAIGMCKLQVLHGLAKVPVLLVQTDLGENLAEGDLLLFLIL